MRAGRLLVWLPPFAAFWPIWRWYAARITDSPEDSCGLLALATAIFLLLRRQKSSNRVGSGSNSETPGLSSIRIPTILVLLLYAATYPFFPPLMRAFLAITCLGLTVTDLIPGRRVPAPVWGLLFLSLPVIPTLQFYLGYPLRCIATHLALPLLYVSGYSVEAHGTTLHWMGNSILVDAPCSGIRMMWTGFYVLFTVCAVSNMRFLKIVPSALFAMIYILIGNALRVALLFIMETSHLPSWFHSGIGILIFLMTAYAIAWSARWIARNLPLPQPMFLHV